jgi:hypothetical protein
VAQHLIDTDLPDGGVEAPGCITIDCATCVMRDTPTCDDCVVTFLCEREPAEAVLLDLSELQALRRLAQAGLAPGLRHRTR